MEKESDHKLETLHKRCVNVSDTRFKQITQNVIEFDHNNCVLFPSDMTELSDLFGATPRPLNYLFTDSKLCYALIFNPGVPYCYA